MSVSIALEDRVALVTGSAGGIGREVGNVLYEAGARVAFADVTLTGEEAVDARQQSIRMDVTDAASVRSGLSSIADRLGPVDILVNNAAIVARHPGRPFTNQERSDWEKVLDVNLIGTFVASREFVLSRPEERPGVIVNMASVAGRIGSQTDPSYSASKAAVINFTQCMAKDLAPDIRVCAVCPGLVRTPMTDELHRTAAANDPRVAELTAEEYFDERAREIIPMGRGQQPRDIAVAVAFLASDLAGAITGQTLNVDGGLVMS